MLPSFTLSCAFLILVGITRSSASLSDSIAQGIPGLPLVASTSGTTQKNTSGSSDGVSCAPRSFGTNKIVCVCNATYCDEWGEITVPSKGLYRVYTSTAAGLRFSRNSEQSFGGSVDPSYDGQITIDRTTKLQKIVGFGGAFTDSTGINIKSLPAAAQAKLIASYFGPYGNGYTIGRVPMGGADFSPRGYTCDDTPGDVNLTKFSLQVEDYNYKIPFIKMAISMSPSPIKLFGSTWSSPPWTKINDNYKGAGWLDEIYWEYWAKYYVKYLQAYRDNGLEFWAVTTQNEPDTCFVPLYPFNCLGWTPEWMIKWIVNHLGPILKNAFPNIDIIMFDDFSIFMSAWVNTILSNPEAAAYISGIAFHWYTNSITGYSPIQDARTKFPNYFLLSTEACNGFLPWELPKVDLGSWDRAESYAADILQGIGAGSGGWVDWNMALNPTGGPNWVKLSADSTIIVNSISDEFYKQPMFYALGHASKFFRPEGTVIGSTVKPQGLQSILCSNCVLTQAVQNLDGSVAVYILNKAPTDLKYSFSDSSDSTQRTTILNLPKNSISTLIYQ